MRRILIVFTAAAVVLLSAFLLWMDGIVGSRGRPVLLPPEEIEFRAERGAPDYVPGRSRVEFTLSSAFENTIEAMERALARGISTLALDVRRSRDGHLVVISDETVERTTDGMGRVEELSLAELRQLDAGNGSRVPMLEEILSQFGGRARYQLELRGMGYLHPYLDDVLEMVDRYEVSKQVSIASRQLWVLWWVESWAPELRTELVVEEDEGLSSRLGLPDRWLDALRIDGVHLPARMVTGERVIDLHGRGVYVIADDVEDGAELARIKQAGADGVTTYFTSLGELPPEIPPHYRLEPSPAAPL